MPSGCSYEYCDHSSGQRFPMARLEGEKNPFQRKRTNQDLLILTISISSISVSS